MNPQQPTKCETDTKVETCVDVSVILAALILARDLLFLLSCVQGRSHHFLSSQSLVFTRLFINVTLLHIT
jgi:hypothetical protein